MMPSATQVTPDGTRSTTVTQVGNRFTIDNGNRVGNNLFHSFGQFSVPTGGAAIFNNAVDVQNIFSRVTGGSVSNIDGVIQANGTANLFLLNPSGILFGPNAALNIGGSFVGTTASSIKFADGVEFSATNSSAPPLLTMSVPIGLQMGSNPGTITVQGSGHRLSVGGSTPVDRSQNPIGLQVSAGNTLALIGGAVNFSGGIVSVKGGGHLEVGSVSDGQVRLNPTLAGWVGDYSAVQQFNDIHLAQQSLLDASGSSGSIQLQGRNINLTDGSVALIQNLDAKPSAGITVRATESLNLTGDTAGRVGMIYIDNLGTGQGGDVTISAAQLSLQNGGQIVNRTFTQGAGGNITANVAGLLEINGEASANSTNPSTITTLTLSSANGGNLTISTGSLRILNGANLSSETRYAGKSGTIQVNAKDLIEVAGSTPVTNVPSSLSLYTFNARNDTNLILNTSRLVIRDSGSVGSRTFATGASGNVTINASESVDISGGGTKLTLPSSLASIAEILNPAAQAYFGISAIPRGDAGSLTINTPSLRITNGAYVTVENDGTGRAGDLQINANTIFLNHQGSITASTASGNGGNVLLNLQQLLLMRHNSLISATAAGNGNGGNLSINSPIIVGLENSDIIANAVQGRGGNINITGQGIIGLAFSNTLTPGTDQTNNITASSEFNVNGMVQINTIGVDPNSGLVELPANVTDPSQQVATGCSHHTGSSFVATGRGGIPQNPTQEIASERTWSDVRDLSAYRKTGEVTVQIPTSPDVLVQATSWHRNPQGKVELIAAQPAHAKLIIDTLNTFPMNDCSKYKSW